MTNSNPITSCPFQRRLDAGGPHDWTRAGPSPHIARFGLAVRARPTDPRTYRKSFEKSKVHQVPARRPPRGLRAFPRRYRHVLRHFHLSGQRPTRRRGRSQHRRGNRCKHTAVRRRHESHARATRCRLRPGLREPGMRGVDRVGGSSPPSLLERRGRGCRRSADLLDDPERPEETLRRGPTLVRDGADGAGVHDRHAGARPTHRPLDHDFRLPSVRSGRLVRGGGGRLRGARQIPDARLRRDASRGCRDYALAPGRHGDREIQRPRRLGWEVAPLFHAGPRCGRSRNRLQSGLRCRGHRPALGIPRCRGHPVAGLRGCSGRAGLRGRARLVGSASSGPRSRNGVARSGHGLVLQAHLELTRQPR